jgi:hypothetical protein
VENQTLFVEMREPILVQIRREWIMGGKQGVEQSDFVEDEISKVVEGEDGLHLAVAQEEGDTDALNKEVE